jgi:endonuclease YncB( thermonuclease family)
VWKEIKKILKKWVFALTPLRIRSIFRTNYSCSFFFNLLKGEKVYLIGEPLPGALDRYGRTLAYVYRAPDGLFVNEEIIRQGYGHVYTQIPSKYMQEFKQLEQFARKAEKGLWGKVEER